MLPVTVLLLLSTTALGCGTTGASDSVEPGDPAAVAGGVRFSFPTPHRVVAERRSADGWEDPQIVFEDSGRECGMVHALASGSTVAATLGCDEHFAEDQAPTRSVALISRDSRTWEHKDLSGEAYATPGLSPQGNHAVWVHGEDLLTWDEGSFGSAPVPDGSAQVVTVEDTGAIATMGMGEEGQKCVVRIRTEGAEEVVPVVDAAKLGCRELGLALETPTEVRGDLSGQPGTEFVVHRAGAGGWDLSAVPAITAPGLDVYPDDPGRAIYNQVWANSRGDLVAVGSPDRQRLTVQRYDLARQRWTPSRVVHDAGAPSCRRKPGDSGLQQGRSFKLRLFCDGTPIVLRSHTGRAWSK